MKNVKLIAQSRKIPHTLLTVIFSKTGRKKKVRDPMRVEKKRTLNS